RRLPLAAANLLPGDGDPGAQLVHLVVALLQRLAQLPNDVRLSLQLGLARAEVRADLVPLEPQARYLLLEIANVPFENAACLFGGLDGPLARLELIPQARRFI